MTIGRLAILGGTGAEGHGLALRFARAGLSVVLGSREAERAAAAASEIRTQLGPVDIRGTTNGDAAESADLIVLTIPYGGMRETVAPLAQTLGGKTVITTIVPLEFVAGVPRVLPVPEGSAAQALQALIPDAHVVGAFHHLSAPTLADLEHPVDADVLVCGDDPEATASALELVALLPGARGIHAGALDGAAYLEAFTAILLRINRRYRSHAGLRITHLPELAKAPP